AVVAEMRRGDGPVLAFRFDMDALPVSETDLPGHRPNHGGFRSRRDGFMHACGHDGHVAIGLDVATRLAADAGWSGTLRLIFQPAEEGGRGAEPIVAAGILDDVDYFFVGHLGCLLPSGKIAAEATDFAHATRYDVIFRGRSAHAAMGPQDGANALLAAATATLSLHAIARHGAAATFVNVGSIKGGSARNLVADRCEISMEVRGMSPEAHDHMQRRADEILAAAAAMQGVDLEIVPMGEMIGNRNSPEAASIVAAAAREVAGIVEVVDGWPIGGGDDATFMIRRVQERGGIAGYFLIGSDIPAVHHAADFDIDERSLEHGTELFTTIARKLLSKDAGSQQVASHP
ncbi:MAG: amidohydrolase, partial [Rhizobiaceae bacterium]